MWFSKCFGPVLVVVLLLAPSLAAGQPQGFRFSREVQTGEIEREELVAVTLDADVYAHTRDRLPDIRLLDAADQPCGNRLDRERFPQSQRHEDE